MSMTQHALRLGGLGIIAAACLVSPAPADAVVGANDATVASTLLLPYFEVDTGNPDGPNTTFTIHDVTAAATLAHVTLWTDAGIPTFVFDLYFTGWDSVTVDLRHLFQLGLFPTTASTTKDPRDTISKKGPKSQDINFATCHPPDGGLPAPQKTPAFVEELKKAHTGRASEILSGQCGGAALGDGIARGYVTADVVVRCNAGLPSTSGYGMSLSSQASLAGSFTLINRERRISFGQRMAAIEVTTTAPAPAPVPGSYSFYGRLNGWSGQDFREALPTTWNVHYYNGAGGAESVGPFASGPTNLIVWRDPGAVVAPFACGSPPPPLGVKSIDAFDMQEHVTKITGNPFPRVAQRVETTDPAFGIPYKAGFLHLDLNDPSNAGGAPSKPGRRQSFVAVIQQASAAKLAVSTTAFGFDNAAD
jgi:hypothetical protein